MARMRLMRDDEAGTLVAVCVYCDARALPDPTRTHHCACRSHTAEREPATPARRGGAA